MNVVALPEQVNISYTANLKEPMLHLTEEKEKISLQKKLINAFDLRLNDIKFNRYSPSDNYIHFYKFYGASFFDVNFGLEEISARLGTPIDPEQVRDLYGRLYKVFGETPVSRQSMTIDRHLSLQVNIDQFLETFTTYVPNEFQESLFGRGVIYNLKNEDHKLFSQIMLTKSLVVKDGLFLNMMFNFFPNQYDFEKAFEIAKIQHDFILNELGIDIEREDTNVSI